ncbi:MAG: type II toxin-antitoxin system VapC family toxin [Thiobacillus sp.]|nr:type II toxin-antitoxin system VapC family toxin [Thiobacillus sp.]MDP2978404.1 type II toxin-antitoxin system VapC family toxin [Thiobacillus sp.]
MIYLLDTNVCIHLLNEKHPAILQHFRQHGPADIAMCSVVKAELLYGARRSQRVEANLQLLKVFFAPLQSLPFDDECAEHYGQIHANLLTQGKPIGPNDTLIAAIARAHDATLVTHNTGEFSRVAGLRMEDWEVA